MEDLLGDYYKIDEIREANGVHHYSEEVPMVKPPIGYLDVPKSCHGHVHSPPRINPLVTEGERNAMLLTPQHGGQECQNMGSSSLTRLSSVQKRTVKRIQVHESGLTLLKGKLPNRGIHYHSYKIIKEYFEPKYDVAKCQLFLALLKYRIFIIVRRILGIKIVKNLKISHHIVRILLDTFQRISKKSRSKYCNVARCVLSQ
jgi:hypothetical protein